AKGADSAVRWLVEAHLLVQISDVTVELPREIGLLLRRDTGPLGPLEPDPPAMATSHRDPAAVDQAAAGQALEMVRHTEALLEALSTEPAAMLRTGGVGVRDLRRLARAADVSEPVAALLIEVAWAAGLLGESSSQAGYAQYLPTVTYDGWRASGIATRWVRLASAWLGMSREPAVIGQRDDRRVVNALSNEVERVGASRRRGAVLDVLGSLPPGAVLDPEGIVAVLTWQEPRRATQASSAAAATTLTEAATLGLAGLDALSGFSRLLLTDPVASDDDPLGVRGGDPPGESSAVKTLDTLLPDPVDRILLQTDLSVVVPGPPEPALATELALLADQESPSVFRITPASVRRALDSGFSAGDLHTFLAKRSTTAVPQPVSYLINDVARRHGGLRAGSAGSYVHSDDKALIAEVAANRRLAALSLRRLAPTVITSPYPIVRLLAALRDAGYAPVAEDATGDAVLVRPKVRRAAARPAGSSRREDPLATPGPSTARINGTIDQIRKGDAAARAASRAPASVRTATRTGSPSPTDHAQALAVLQRAIRDNTLAWVGYVDAHGSPVSRLLRPVSMGGGFLRAEDERAETIHTFALHRITAAAING
ncbi:MAG: hypothetical protein HKP61_10410, partial [Dactylosporangium sp.]|nr:helicase C-terminal domain-containing protein [Dactylosporangium sp.]NNJ61341.1 hypothetical protein [Dactylosporangium sp.]